MNKSILIVEDEFIVANDLRLMLNQAGYKVSGIVDSAEEAIGHIQKNKPDLVLVDIRLKGKQSGIDLARKLRVDNIAFVYLSANSNQAILEEAKTTEPYGFLVKPFREKDLLVMIDIALYRHKHSLESKLRQEEHLQKNLAEICDEHSDAGQKMLRIAKELQSFMPFEMVSAGSRPLIDGQFNDIGYLRIGFDEYQFIGEKELLTITRLKKQTLSKIVDSNNTYTKPSVNNEASSLQKLLFETFDLQSFMIFPVTLNYGLSVHFFFYSRQRDVYTGNHIALLNRLKIYFTTLAEAMIYNDTSSTKKPKPGYIDRKHIETDLRQEFKGIIGSHHLLLSALDLAAQVAPYNTSVLLLGESGTGKEKVAQIIHSFSPRKNASFIKVNCAAIPSTLMESELFGHEKGAFTGAIENRKGKFELADGGTIFLDEIGELPLDMQVKLLRVLQEKEIEHIGGSLPRKIDVRIVAATNRNLEKEVAQGNFRLDLYYRLNVFPIMLPALRERRTDIEPLALFFANQFCKALNKPFNGISELMMQEMFAYDWPGNIRELENVLEQAVILNDGRSRLELRRSFTVVPDESFVKTMVNNMDDVKLVQRETEKDYIVSILKKVKGRIRGANGAAEIMNIKPTTLESKMAKLNIRKQDYIDLI